MAFTSGHGSVEAFWQDGMLIVEPRSTFNVEGLLKAIEAIKQQIDQRAVDQWVRVVVFHSDDIVGPVDGGQYIAHSVAYGKEKGCVSVCVVGGNAMNREGYRQVCEYVGLPLYCFDNLEEAKVFLSQSQHCQATG